MCSVQIQNYDTSKSVSAVCRPLGMDDVTVVVPTLNEALSIGKVLCEMPWNFLGEVIVVDSSNDDTPEIVKRFGAVVIRETHKGYGRALQTGIESAQGDIVVFIDGDYTYDPEDVPRVVKPILDGKCDVVLGNRLNGKMHPGAMDLVNRVGNTILSLIFTIVFFRRVNDSQCGLRAIRKRFLDGLSYEDYGMPYVTEQLAKLAKKGARIGNVPISYRPRIGTTKLCKWTDGFTILKTILKERVFK